MDESTRLRPYVARYALEWLRDSPQKTHQRIDGTLAFVDVSGFTALTERLAARGKAGAEEMGDYLDATFTSLLDLAYEYGAGLVKWGGDATLLLFRDDGHAARAARAAWEMSQAMSRIGKLRTSAGRVTLRVSIGVDTGPVDLFLLGHDHRELLVVGPTASTTARMEAIADAGEVAVSPGTAAQLDAACLGRPKGDALLLAAAPIAEPMPARTPPSVDGLDVGCLLPPPIRANLVGADGEGAHRPVTAGFIQVSGLDQMLATDGPEATGSRLSQIIERAQQAALQHRVTFLEWDIAADGGKIILLGGVPMAHGNDEERVLRAVKDVVALDQPPLQMRGGVNCGRVYAGEFGPSFRRTWSVAGDAINLAARLMATAEPGHVLATGPVLERCGSAFTVAALPPFLVKGKKEPVAAYDIGEVRATRLDVDSDRLPLVGRDDELALLVDSATEVSAGSGRVIELVAEPGMGKTRLLAEAIERWPVGTLRVVCDDYEAGIPYQPVRRLLLGALDLADDADEVDIAARLSGLIDDRAASLAPWRPLLEDVLGLPPSQTTEVDALEPKFRRPRLEESVVGLLRAVVTAATAIVIEDVHAMDEASASLVAKLADDSVDRPWLLVVARRPLETGYRPSAGAHVTSLALAPLRAEATGQLAEIAEDQEPLPPHEHAALLQRSGGNPLFLRELIRARREAGSLDELPDSVEGLLHAQIDRLGAADQRLLRAAAVLGMRFDDGLLQHIVDDGARIDPDVWQRLKAFVVREGGLRRFSHGLVRDAAYEGLSFRRRRVLHLRAGRAIESLPATGAEDRAGLLSLHYFHAGEYDEAWLYAMAAADRAAALYANVEAAELYARALSAGRRLREVGKSSLADVWECLGDMRYRLADDRGADAAYRGARALRSGDPVRLARLAEKQAQLSIVGSSRALALRRLSIGRRLLSGRGDREAMAVDAELTARYGLVYLVSGDYRNAERACHEALAIAARADADKAALAAMWILDYADIQRGRLGVPEQDTQAFKAIPLAERLGDLPTMGRLYNQLGYRAYYEGRWDEARTWYERARDACLRAGDEWNGAVYGGNIAEILAEQGHLDDAEPMLRREHRTLRAAGGQREAALLAALLARIAAQRGRLDEATEHIAQAREAVGERDALWSPQVDARAAECLAITDRAGDTLAAVEEAMRAVANDDGLCPQMPTFQRLRGWALARLGRWEEADVALAASGQTAIGLGSLHEEAATAELRARLAPLFGTDGDDAAARAGQLYSQLGIVAPLHLPLDPDGQPQVISIERETSRLTSA
ncbi:MAG: adenylate/guanylate cyclase domain-containing protein [Actinomycetes bacterium]